MLSGNKVMAMVAVSDLDKAKQFYGETLGLKVGEENPGGIGYDCGGCTLFVYPTPNAGTNKATSATWQVTNIEETVATLKEKGVEFEEYESMGATVSNSVHTWEGMKAAWFKDPDGNILGLAADAE